MEDESYLSGIIGNGGNENRGTSKHVLHKLVELMRQRLLHHFYGLILNLQIHPRRDDLANWQINQYQAHINLANIEYTCRAILSLAADLTTLQTVFDVKESKRKDLKENQRLDTLLQRIVNDCSQQPSTLLAISTAMGLRNISNTEQIVSLFKDSQYFRFLSQPTPEAPHDSDILTSRNQTVLPSELLNSQPNGHPEIIKTEEDAMEWIKPDKPPLSQEEMAQITNQLARRDILHSRLMTHP